MRRGRASRARPRPSRRCFSGEPRTCSQPSRVCSAERCWGPSGRQGRVRGSDGLGRPPGQVDAIAGVAAQSLWLSPPGLRGGPVALVSRGRVPRVLRRLGA
eukprot:5452037-Lingulodinium_polyedra.AAC.1